MWNLSFLATIWFNKDPSQRFDEYLIGVEFWQEVNFNGQQEKCVKVINSFSSLSNAHRRISEDISW